MQRRFITLLVLFLTFSALAFSTQRGYTQDANAGGECPTLVKQALEAVGDNCGGLARNSACYGFNRVNATFAESVAEDFFSRPADQTDLKLLQSIDTAALNESIQEWGVAVMSVQANIPNSLPGQAVSFILLGDVQLDNAVPPDDAVEPAAESIAVSAISSSNIRTLPTTNSNIIGSVAAGTALGADATNPTKDWVRVIFNNQTPGWISRALVQTEGNLDSLPVFATDSRTPMQAFYFKTGIGEPACTQSPDVLVVQGPERVAVDITANGANIHIGSTVAFRTIEGNRMQVITISGEATVNGSTVPVGYLTTVQLSDDGTSVVGEPEDPRPLTQEELDTLIWMEDMPTSILNYPINIPDEEATEPVPTSVPSSGSSGTVQQPAFVGVNCAPFKATSPLDGLNFGMNIFYWDAAPGATSYRVNVDGAGSKEVTAPTTNAAFDISGAGTNPQMTWSVDALYNGVVVCSTPGVTIPRQWAPPPPPTVPPPPPAAPGSFQAYWSCTNYDFTVFYGSLPAGTTSITINFSSSGDTYFPSPIELPTSTSEGSYNMTVYTEGSSYDLWGGSVVAHPSGITVGLPDLTCTYAA
ncbi:MAG: SH3 domain-containing protein [Chloroflexi bacterium]|nr:SH3 domain-containing protein [Chloroflexota bacterium]MCC6893708.1 SH3 domain-containing protein [Anaerolineae bacterium]